MYDMVIKEGFVIDPSTGLKGLLDIGIKNGRIEDILPDISVQGVGSIISAKGNVVVPGLIDAHVHVYGFPLCVHPDIIGVQAGVTTMLDAGSGGCDTFSEFPDTTVPEAITDIYCLLNLASKGLTTMPKPELLSRKDMDIPRTIQKLESYNERAKGVKVRTVGPVAKELGTGLIKIAQDVQTSTDSRLMVHIGDPFDNTPSVTPDFLPMLKENDIVTHMFTPHIGGILDGNGRVFPQVSEAVQCGVCLDIGMGRSAVSFDVAQRLLDQGIEPYTISTDLTLPGRTNPIFSLTEVMSWCMALGYSLEDVILRTTHNAAKVLGMSDDIGTLKKGSTADITILNIVDGPWTFSDTDNGSITGKKAIEPLLTIKNGVAILVGKGPHPWGWLPNELK